LKPRISKMSEDLFKIELRGCFICSGVKSENPACQLLIGTFVGCCSVVFKERFSCKEVQCKASGDKSCVFFLRRH
jgi:predicted hydrocarbon binding protein